jgi:hypothetical protein
MKAQWLTDKKGNKTGKLSYGDGAFLPKKAAWEAQALDAFYAGNKNKFSSLLGNKAIPAWAALDRKGKNLDRKTGLKILSAFSV